MPNGRGRNRSLTRLVRVPFHRRPTAADARRARPFRPGLRLLDARNL